MPFNVTSINSALFAAQPFVGAPKGDGKNFVKNAYAVQGNLEHPEARTNYSDTDHRGRNVYFLA